MNGSHRLPAHVFSTSPQSKDHDRKSYLNQVVQVAQWSEEAGCTGILVYTDNGIVDPWLVAQVIIQSTERLCPLVAVQPVYMHPYTVAKMVSTLGFLYNRRVYLNMVAGGFKNDLLALNDTTPHNQRYTRLTEYTTIIKDLLNGRNATSCKGEFYTVERLKLLPELPESLFPGIFMSGSSESGLAAAKEVGATAIQYPRPPAEYERFPLDPSMDSGIRIGIIARKEEREAWEVAYERFPEDRKGQVTHQLAMKVSDSVWHKQLSDLATAAPSGENPYWLRPFENYKTNCPYLVGSYQNVAQQLRRYMNIGYKSFILDIPPTSDELDHIRRAFSSAHPS
jgi:alkanesulfonate monooxygenase